MNGTCECGCGKKTPLAREHRPSRGMFKGTPLRFIPGHQGRTNIKRALMFIKTGPDHHCWKGGRSSSAPYEFLKVPDHPRADSRGYVQEHILIAEKAVGRLLPRSIEVHHVDGNPKHNTNSNLVVCQDHSYHMLIHQRTRAYRESGHADWRSCAYCNEFSPPSELYIFWLPNKRGSRAYHRTCKSDYDKARKLRRKSA